jgi:hypothetical protein
MEIIDNRYLAVRTRNPSKIMQVIKNSQVVHKEDDISTVAVEWQLSEAQWLSHLNFKGVPSPIHRDYQWPGLYTPMSHQRDTAEFLTLNRRAFCFNEQGTGKTASAIWASDYLMTRGYGVAPASVVSSLNLLNAAFSALSGWVFFGESLAWAQWLGMGLMVAGIVAVALQAASRPARRTWEARVVS